MTTNKIIIFCAPSGSGKTTIVKKIKEIFPMLSASVSATSRKPRSNEIDGVDYYFISNEDFKKKIEEEKFIEWEEVYSGQFSGTLKSEVSRIQESGKNPLFEIDVKGAMNLKKMYGDSALVIFIKVPYDILKERLISRNTETGENLKKRLDRVKEEMEFEHLADRVIVNINLQDAIEECKKIISNFIGI
jgi:guanylate kinase